MYFLFLKFMSLSKIIFKLRYWMVITDTMLESMVYKMLKRALYLHHFLQFFIYTLCDSNMIQLQIVLLNSMIGKYYIVIYVFDSELSIKCIDLIMIHLYVLMS